MTIWTMGCYLGVQKIIAGYRMWFCRSMYQNQDEENLPKNSFIDTFSCHVLQDGCFGKRYL
jgi:hypothetical protein